MEVVYYGGNDYRDYLSHHGILGQHWGKRNGPPYPLGVGDHSASEKKAGWRKSLNKSEATRTTKRLARKDAKEFARSTMYYGEGAGTRRKRIKATVEDRKKKIPGYKEEFEKSLSRQDMAKHASAAKRERVVNSSVATTKKTARGVFNLAIGNAVPVTATSIAVYNVMKYSGMDKKVKSAFVESGKRAVDAMKRMR